MTIMMTKLLCFFNFFMLFNNTGANITNEANESQPFIKINRDCLVSFQTNYSCLDIDQMIDYDPYRSEDVKYICGKCFSKASFTIQDFANRVNYRLKSLDLNHCNVSVYSEFVNKQFKYQCPNAMVHHCF